jgi:hypothetical protein
MNWLDTIPVALAAVGWLILPGLLGAYAIGIRGVAAWALAPTLSVAVISVTATVAGKLGIHWSVPLVLIASLLVVVVAGVVALLLRRRFAVVRPADPRPVTAAGLIGMLPAIALGALTVVLGMGSPENLSQTFDAVFHYNALAYILDSGNASPLTLASIGTPGIPVGFYPGAWHDYTSLTLLSSGASIPVATNVATGVIVAVGWPLGCLLLVRQVAGRSVPAMAITGVLSTAFTAFPWGLISFGVLWPNTLGLALLPAGLAVVLSIAGLAKEDALSRAHAWVLLPVVLLAGGFAHPNSLFSLVALAVVPVFVGIGRWALRMRREGRTSRGVIGVAVSLVVFFGAFLWAATTPIFAPVRSFYWKPFETTAKALGEALLGATNDRPSLWALSAVVIVGLFLVWRVREQRWLIGSFAVSVLLFVLTAAVNTPITMRITGYWYNDSYRLAAMLPVIAVPLAVLSLVRLADLARERLTATERLGRLGASTLALTLVLTVVLAILGKGLYIGDHVRTVALNYTGQDTSNTGNLVDSDERAFYNKIKNEIPENAVVASNPWDGSSLIWALINRKPLYPHLQLTLSPEQKYLAKHLIQLGQDPAVCTDARSLGVSYMLIGDFNFWPWDAQIKDYPGIVDPGSRPGFELVDSSGKLKLYKITGCGVIPAPATR